MNEIEAKTVHRGRQERGAALLSVALVISAIALMSTAILARYVTGVEQMTPAVGGFNSVVSADIVRSTVVTAVEAALKKNESPTEADVAREVSERIAADLPEGFTVGRVTAKLVLSLPFSEIYYGPFAGLKAVQREYEVSYEIRRGRLVGGTKSDEASRLTVVVHASRLSPLHFLQFWDRPFTELYWGGGGYLGRVHANGDVCIGWSWGSFPITEPITAAGRAMHRGDPRCAMQVGSWDSSTSLRLPSGATVGFNRGQGASGGGNTNGCTNCNGTQQAWKTYSAWHLDRHILDSSHSVPKLTLLEAEEAVTQNGVNGDPDSAAAQNQSNKGSLRFLIDPPRASDSPAVRQMKFAHRADLRIIDGAWYLRNPSDPNDWPGIPIWSDHPGNFMDPWGQLVGQANLRARWSWASTPRRYSPYRYDEVAGRLEIAPEGALFYGLGASSMSDTPYQFLPQFRHGTCYGGTPHEICTEPGTGIVSPAYIGGCGSTLANDAVSCRYATGSPFNEILPDSTKWLLAARQGFNDRHWGPRGGRKILPANLSLKRLAEALASNDPGELGSYFGSGRFMRGAFNGIVYVSVTWPGSNSGFGSAVDPSILLPPAQGAEVDPVQIPATSPTDHEQRALPYQLCSLSLAGEPLDPSPVRGTPLVRFRVPNCSSYGRASGQIAAYANAIRIVEGEDLRPFGSQGLSVVSNVPVYVNTFLNTQGWVPALIGGDQVTLIARQYQPDTWDGNSGGEDHGANPINAAILGGWNTPPPSTGSSGSVEMPGRLSSWAEWRGNLLQLTGSMVMGFYPVYYRTGHVSTGTAPTNYRLEERFQDPATRPPGMPDTWTASMKQWQRH